MYQLYWLRDPIRFLQPLPACIKMLVDINWIQFNGVTGQRRAALHHNSALCKKPTCSGGKTKNLHPNCKKVSLVLLEQYWVNSPNDIIAARLTHHSKMAYRVESKLQTLWNPLALGPRPVKTLRTDENPYCGGPVVLYREPFCRESDVKKN